MPRYLPKSFFHRIQDTLGGSRIMLGDECVNVRQILFDDRKVPIDPRFSHVFARLRARVASSLPRAAQTVPGDVLRVLALVPHAHNPPGQVPQGNLPWNRSRQRSPASPRLRKVRLAEKS